MKKLEKNIHDAFDQLRGAYNRTDNSLNVRGFVAISIERLLDPRMKLIEARSITELDVALRSTLLEFVNDHQGKWMKEVDIKTIGVIIYYRGAAILLQERLFTPFEKLCFDTTTLQGSADCAYYLTVCDLLQKGLDLQHS
jgi:hypothetical protein